MMHILLQFLGIKESGPVFTYELAKGLIENGENVYAILNSDIENREKWEGLLKKERIFFVKDFLSRKRPVRSGLKFVNELRRIKKFFKGCEFDCSIRTFVDKYDNIIANMLQINKVVNFCHDPVPHSGVSFEDARKSKNLINKADKIVVLTKEFIPIIRDEYARKEKDIIFIRHGVLPYSNGKQICKREYKTGKEVQFLFFGRIDPYKGVDILTEAFLSLGKYSDIKLIIAGSGDISKISETIGKMKNVEIVNRYIHDYEVDELFRRENVVLVLPYKDATQSGVATVAFEYGVPVIASNTGGLKEQLFDGKVGLLVKAGDTDDLATAMQRFLNEDGLYNKQVELMEEYRKDLGWNKITGKLMEEVFA